MGLLNAWKRERRTASDAPHPHPLAVGIGVLAFQGIGQVDLPMAIEQVVLVNGMAGPELLL